VPTLSFENERGRCGLSDFRATLDYPREFRLKAQDDRVRHRMTVVMMRRRFGADCVFH